ncbi:diacylglycerol kinase family protein [Mucilaginibacter rubeus]|uniref:Diacylglycerol kinase family protein n=1 Tax=Mucilaginibacter rubeus TaxID=2027860 RepID=A0A5C1I753_9SPHI|nr:diacylglycerol kinase family protein [Mucilaginibacter rubeus]QEM13855.1 diacylglycerol kinase family protein [Mucilaginibacter rubeus]
MKRLIRSFGFAFKGLGYAAHTQPNFRFHLVAGTIAIILGFLFRISTAEWLWLMISIAIVLIAELLNTSLETLTDLVSPTYNEKAGRVKDVAAGAVVIAALFALITGAIIFLPKIILALGSHAA